MESMERHEEDEKHRYGMDLLKKDDGKPSQLVILQCISPKWNMDELLDLARHAQVRQNPYWQNQLVNEALGNAAIGNEDNLQLVSPNESNSSHSMESSTKSPARYETEADVSGSAQYRTNGNLFEQMKEVLERLQQMSLRDMSSLIDPMNPQDISVLSMIIFSKPAILLPPNSPLYIQLFGMQNEIRQILPLMYSYYYLTPGSPGTFKIIVVKLGERVFSPEFSLAKHFEGNNFHAFGDSGQLNNKLIKDIITSSCGIILWPGSFCCFINTDFMIDSIEALNPFINCLNDSSVMENNFFYLVQRIPGSYGKDRVRIQCVPQIPASVIIRLRAMNGVISVKTGVLN